MRRIEIGIGFFGAIYFTLMRTPLLGYKIASGSIQRLIWGQGLAPMQYRCLTYWILRLCYPLFGRPEDLLLACQIIDFVSIVVFFYILIKLLEVYRLDPRLIFWAIPMTVFQYCFQPGTPSGYPFDIPALCFFTAGLLFLKQRRMSAFYLIFVFGTLNRETTILLTGILVIIVLRRVITLHKWDSFPPVARQTGLSVPWQTGMVIFHIIIQILIWLVIKIFLWYIFQGDLASIRFHDTPLICYNLRHLTNLTTLVWVGSSFCFLWLPVVSNISKIKDPIIYNGIIVFIIYFIVLLFVGIVYELRIYGEFIPVFLIGLGFSWGRLANDK